MWLPTNAWWGWINRLTLDRTGAAGGPKSGDRKIGVELKRSFFTKAKLARMRLNRSSQSGVIALCYWRGSRYHRWAGEGSWADCWAETRLRYLWAKQIDRGTKNKWQMIVYWSSAGESLDETENSLAQKGGEDQGCVEAADELVIDRCHSHKHTNKRKDQVRENTTGKENRERKQEKTNLFLLFYSVYFWRTLPPFLLQTLGTLFSSENSSFIQSWRKHIFLALFYFLVHTANYKNSEFEFHP